MIFLSHNHRDKDLIRPIAKLLSAKFGKDNIFYDEWSIKYGESIIGRMDEGISSCQFFFYFISQNSLKSGMVGLEWKSALSMAMRNECVFIPVRIDECDVHKIISDIRYIDMVSLGFSETANAMIASIEGRTAVTDTSDEPVSGLTAVLAEEQERTCIIELYSKFLIRYISLACFHKYNKVDLSLKILGVPMQRNSTATFTSADGEIMTLTKVETMAVGVSPDVPIRILYTIKGTDFRPIRALLARALAGDKFEVVNVYTSANCDGRRFNGPHSIR